MNSKTSAYAQSGVDYTKIEPFKQEMIDVGRRTFGFPNSRDVHIDPAGHGAVFQYDGSSPHKWCHVTEGLGNLNWIAEWMYERTGHTYYDVIAWNCAQIIAIDVIAQGAMPVIWTDEVAAGDSGWFADCKRSRDYACGCLAVCRAIGCALPAGESPALRYLVSSEPPVKSAPVLSGSMTGLIAPSDNMITGEDLSAGDFIIGIPSSGLHANGISLVIERAMQMPDQFLTKVPGGRSLGEECLRPMASYVTLVEMLLAAKAEIHAILPGTGSGIAKLAYDKRELTYRVTGWPEVPPLMKFMHQSGVSMKDCLTTFNWGVGLYLFVPDACIDQVLGLCSQHGWASAMVVGRVEKGSRQVIYEPERLTLPPPGE